jgi:hypothetical protein
MYWNWWRTRHSDQTIERCIAAFPSDVSGDVRAVLTRVPKDEHGPTEDGFDAFVAGGQVKIPYRVYFAEPPVRAVTGLTARQRLVLAALFTRHHNGFVRERWLRELGRSADSWMAPFVVHLLGEYVMEIAQAIEAVIPIDRSSYRAFADANPELCRVISARMVNYWALYYRRQVSSFAEYPAYQVACELGVWRGRPPRKRRAR